MDAEVVHLVLAANPSDDDIFDAGWQATRAGASPSGVEALIEGGLNVNAVLTTSRRGRDSDGMSSTLLIMAASRNAAIASFLLRHGASVAVRNRSGETALMAAVMYNQPDIVRLFILAGAASGEDGAASLRRAEWCDFTEVAELLSQAVRENDLLFQAAYTGDCATVLTLLGDSGMAVDAPRANGMSLLMVAASTGHARLVAVLLRRGAIVDLQDRNGCTALMLVASSQDCPGIVGQLLAAGATFALRNAEGMTAPQLAKQAGHTRVVGVFKSHIARALATPEAAPASAEAEATAIAEESRVSAEEQKAAAAEKVAGGATSEASAAERAAVPSAIVDAVACGDMKAVMAWLDASGRIGAPGEDGLTLFMVAAVYGKSAVAAELAGKEAAGAAAELAAKEVEAARHAKELLAEVEAEERCKGKTSKKKKNNGGGGGTTGPPQEQEEATVAAEAVPKELVRYDRITRSRSYRSVAQISL